jgi:pectin methylesterase-like acyl-CoA thioesterase
MLPTKRVAFNTTFYRRQIDGCRQFLQFTINLLLISGKSSKVFLQKLNLLKKQQQNFTTATAWEQLVSGDRLTRFVLPNSDING